MKALNRKIAPAFHQVSNIEFLSVSETKLDNGIELNYINGGSQEILKIDFIFNAGNWHQDRPLIASSTSQLIKEGTKSYTAYEISEGIDKYGAFFEIENGYDTTTLTLYTLTKHLDNVLPYVKEIILTPKFSANEFDIYKNNAVERFKINLEKVSFVARGLFMSTVFGETHPYGRMVIAEDYERLSLPDLTNFYHQNYNLSNCRILVSGKVDKSTIESLNNLLGEEKITANNIVTKELSLIPNDKSSVYEEKENALQSAIRIGRLIPNKLHKDYFGLQILNTILGGYFGSRLMNNIREDKGYTYGIGSGLVSLKNSGYFFISTEVGSNVTQDALKEIYKEIDLLRINEVSQAELDLVKNYILGQLLKSFDGPFNVATLYESVHLFGLDCDFYNSYIKVIKEITPKTLKELAEKYFNPNDLNEIVVGQL